MPDPTLHTVFQSILEKGELEACGLDFRPNQSLQPPLILPWAPLPDVLMAPASSRLCPTRHLLGEAFPDTPVPSRPPSHILTVSVHSHRFIFLLNTLCFLRHYAIYLIFRPTTIQMWTPGGLKFLSDWLLALPLAPEAGPGPGSVLSKYL